LEPSDQKEKKKNVRDVADSFPSARRNWEITMSLCDDGIQYHYWHYLCLLLLILNFIFL
jgi:hypothetical protein